MKRILIVVFVVITAALLFSGCKKEYESVTLTARRVASYNSSHIVTVNSTRRWRNASVNIYHGYGYQPAQWYGDIYKGENTLGYVQLGIITSVTVNGVSVPFRQY